MSRANIAAMVGIALLGSMQVAHARGFEVYGYGGPKQGEAELVYNYDYVNKSDLTMTFFKQNDVSREGLHQHTLEMEYGFTDKWSSAIYFDWEQPKGEDLSYIQTRAVAARYNFFNKGERFFDGAVYFEYYAPRERYLGGTDTKDALETRIILEKDLGAWNLKLNPVLEKVLSGSNVEEGMELELAAGLYRKTSEKLQFGLEFYDKFGEIAKLAKWKDQERYLVPTVDYEVKDGIAIHVGYAFGNSDNSDDQVLTTRFEFEI
jgi:hypothetical protein